MFLSFVSIPAFVISFLVGLVFIYLLGAEEKKIYLYPNPQNIMNTLYKDKADQCFQFLSNEVSCPSDTSLIQDVPMQA
jgi:hypothetical protein